MTSPPIQAHGGTILKAPREFFRIVPTWSNLKTVPFCAGVPTLKSQNNLCLPAFAAFEESGRDMLAWRACNTFYAVCLKIKLLDLIWYIKLLFLFYMKLLSPIEIPKWILFGAFETTASVIQKLGPKIGPASFPNLHLVLAQFWPVWAKNVKSTYRQNMRQTQNSLILHSEWQTSCIDLRNICFWLCVGGSLDVWSTFLAF